MEIKDNKLYYRRTNKFDIVENFFLAQTKVFKDVRYDDNLKLAEHTDFFLQLKKLNKWKIDRTEELIGNHYPIRSSDYAFYRNRGNIYAEVMKRKWNVTEGIYES
jgi:hypothetical protein